MSQTARGILRPANVRPSDIFKGRYLPCALEREGVAGAPARAEWGLQLGEVTWGEKVGKGWTYLKEALGKVCYAFLLYNILTPLPSSKSALALL